MLLSADLFPIKNSLFRLNIVISCNTNTESSCSDARVPLPRRSARSHRARLQRLLPQVGMQSKHDIPYPCRMLIARVSQTPVRHSGCANRMDEGACMEAADRCEWWCGSKCVYSFETERLGHCGDQGDRSGTPGITMLGFNSPPWCRDEDILVFQIRATIRARPNSIQLVARTRSPTPTSAFSRWSRAGRKK